MALLLSLPPLSLVNGSLKDVYYGGLERSALESSMGVENSNRLFHGGSFSTALNI